jgi:hypothetical protein
MCRLDISINLILVELDRVLRLVELSRFLLRYRVDINRNLRLVDPSRFLIF